MVCAAIVLDLGVDGVVPLHALVKEIGVFGLEEGGPEVAVVQVHAVQCLESGVDMSHQSNIQVCVLSKLALVLRLDLERFRS